MTDQKEARHHGRGGEAQLSGGYNTESTALSTGPEADAGLGAALCLVTRLDPRCLEPMGAYATSEPIAQYVVALDDGTEFLTHTIRRRIAEFPRVVGR